MTSTIVTKQGKPSKPGEKVDTSAAKVVPPSPEVKAEAAAKEVAAQRKATQARVGAQAKAMTAKPKSTGNGSGPAARLTDVWTGKDRKDVKVKDRVTTAEGVMIDVIGRWTKKTAKGNVPMVTGHIVSAAPDGKKVGDRLNAVAAGCTHAKK
jgi:hypothetical protein